MLDKVEECVIRRKSVRQDGRVGDKLGSYETKTRVRRSRQKEGGRYRTEGPKERSLRTEIGALDVTKGRKC